MSITIFGTHFECKQCSLKGPLIVGFVATALVAFSFLSALVSAQPRPPFYGVYALVNGKLREIPEATYLGGGATDQRVPEVQFSFPVTLSEPPKARFSTGRIAFVVFDRNLASFAPASATILIVGQVVTIRQLN